MARVAVFATHGMGQQTKFQTMAAVAEGLRRAVAEQTNVALEEVKAARPSTVKLGDEVTQRLRMDIGETEVDVFEAYWAPVTEGAIKISELMSYLRAAGVGGLRILFKGYQRTIFNQVVTFRVEYATGIYLLVALAVIYALMFINSTIVLVAAQKTKLADVPWLNESIGALTAGAGVTCAVAIAYALATAAAGLLKARIDELRARFAHKARVALQQIPLLLAAAFFSLLFTIVLIALAMLGAMAGKWNALVSSDAWENYGEDVVAAIGQLLTGFSWTTIVTSTGAAVWALVCAIVVAWTVVRPASMLSRSTPQKLVAKWLGAAFAILLCAAGGWLLLQLLPQFLGPFRQGWWMPSRAPAFQHQRWLWLWGVLLWLSTRVKRVAEQYPGDVAIYVGSHRMDNYDRIRDEIRKRTCSIATALFSAKKGANWRYDKIIFVGHSLGSVIVYDTLNRVMLLDELANRPLDVVARTGGLLTFGSPLDKTAYLFALNRSEGHPSEEELANTVQPLLQSYANRRFPWVNVHSMLDIISGNLTFFDQRSTKHPGAVLNLSDDDALAFVTHHTHYWKGRTVWGKLYEMITERKDAQPTTPIAAR